MFSNPGDEVFHQQLETAISTVAQSIKTVLYAMKELKINMDEGTEEPMTPREESNSTIPAGDLVTLEREREKIMR